MNIGFWEAVSVLAIGVVALQLQSADRTVPLGAAYLVPASKAVASRGDPRVADMASSERATAAASSRRFVDAR